MKPSSNPPTAVYHHARDAAGVFLRAARTSLDGAPVYNLGGTTASMTDIVAAIVAAAPEMDGRITIEPRALDTPTVVDDSALETALGHTEWIDLTTGVRETVDLFRRAVRDGKVDVERILA